MHENIVYYPETVMRTQLKMSSVVVFTVDPSGNDAGD